MSEPSNDPARLPLGLGTLNAAYAVCGRDQVQCLDTRHGFYSAVMLEDATRPAHFSFLLGGHDEILHKAILILNVYRPARQDDAGVYPRPGECGRLLTKTWPVQALPQRKFAGGGR